MALVTPNIMSTTTCLQLEELQKKPANFHRYMFSEPPSNVANAAKQGNKIPVSKTLVSKQKVLLLKGVREQYTLVDDHSVPSILNQGEILVKVSLLLTFVQSNSLSHLSKLGPCSRPQPY